jgi:nucleotide sugar dehydrogenase
MRVAIVGAGKMGLPLACQMASRGADVMAIDANAEVVTAIRQGRMLFEEPGVGELLAAARSDGRIDATALIGEGIRGRDVVIVIIPVLLTVDRQADLGIITSVTRQIAAALEAGMMISYETTLPVGTTRKILAPLLEKSGLKAGTDFDLVFSPERVKSRLVLDHLANKPKIVGGINASSATRAEEFYSRYLGAPVINVQSLEASEYAKLAGMMYRDVNIALANELAMYAEAAGIDFEPVRRAANTDGEALLLSPGIGVGGHCTPVYPYFLLGDAAARGLSLPLTAKGREVNDAQSMRHMERLAAAGYQPSGGRVLILGLGFRPQVKEHTCSTAFLLRDAALRLGATPVLHDSLYTAQEISAHGFEPFDLAEPNWPGGVVLNTAHDAYQKPDFRDWRRRGVTHVVDGRNAWDSAEARAAGLVYLAPGVAGK